MGKLLSVLIFVFGLSSANSAASCVDITGNYRPPYETESDDVVTTIIYKQIGCNTLMISGYAVGKPHFENESRNYGVQVLSLDGSPAPKGLNCRYNSYPGVCASYKAEASYITKATEQPNIVPGVENNEIICHYKSSQFSKDAEGNLIEMPVDVKCSDGSQGPVAPVIWKKASE